MTNKHLLLLCLLLWGLGEMGNSLHAQTHTISGYVRDVANGEFLINGTVAEISRQKGTLTNDYGFFSLTLPEDSVDIVVSYAGYQSQRFRFQLKTDTTLNVSLDYLAVDEVEIIAEDIDRPVTQTQMSRIDIPIEQIELLPALLGEVDVVKAIQLLPGVQSGSEGSSGLYVRGGGPDQNLILLDGVPLYYVSHLGGFFSVFNTDALSSVQLYKGGFPARYGGRLSSVLDIRMKEGNMQEYEVEGSIGIISSKISVQGPIQKGKTSFIFSGRRTYLDLLSRPISRLAISAASDGNESGSFGYFFHDFNGKINHTFSDKDRLYLSFYSGLDRAGVRAGYNDGDYRETTDISLGWGTNLVALRWNHLWNDRLFSNLTVTGSRYQFRTQASGEGEIRENGDWERSDLFEVEYLSRITDYAAKLDFDYYPSPAHDIRFGISTTYHTYEPSTLGLNFDDGTESQDTSITSKIDQPWETAVYIEDNIKLGQRFSTNIGVHGVHYRIGDQDNFSIQPRISSRLLLSPNLSVKASFAQMTQFVHLLTNSTVGLPVDLWVPATERVPAQNSWQVAAGFSASLFDGEIEASLEGYYKEMDGLIAFKEGNNFLLSGLAQDSWEDAVEIGGEGETYGVELLLQKKRGATTGWIGYTLSWNYRTFENLNNGEPFPYKYDRRHDISVVVSHRLSDRITLAATWVYGTGNAITLPTAGYAALNPYGYYGSYVPGFDNLLSGIGSWSGNGVLLYEGGRNNFRMQAYHRLDLGINLTKKKRWGERTWSFGVYNAYSRLNPFTYYFDQTYNFRTGEVEAPSLKKLALFPIIPGVSYQFKF